MDIPKPGDVIYLDSELYVGHGEDDFRGGKATVFSVSGKAPFVQVVQNPGKSYNWAVLAQMQDRLAVKFGDTWAQTDPDPRPKFNEEC